MPKQRRKYSLTPLAEKMAKERGIDFEPTQMMPKEIFEVLIKDEDISTLLSEGGVDLTPSQMKRVKEVAKRQSREKLEAKAMELALSPGYQAFVTMPVIKKILENSTKPQEQTQQSPAPTQSVEKPQKEKKYKKSIRKDPQTNSVAAKLIVPIKQNDSVTDIFAKMYNLMERRYEEQKKLWIEEDKEKKKQQNIQEQRTQEIVKLFGGKYRKKSYKPVKKPDNTFKKIIQGLLLFGGIAAVSSASAAVNSLPPIPNLEDMLKDLLGGLLDPVIDLFEMGKTGTVTTDIKDLIGMESAKGGYNQLVIPDKTVKPIDMPKKLTDMTIQEVYALQDKMKAAGYPSTAVGRYQVIKSTLEDQVKKLGLNPATAKYDEDTQDLILENLLKQAGLAQFQSGQMSKEDFQNSLAKTWAAIPVTRDMQGANGPIKAGQSYYAGVGPNKAFIPQQKIDITLDKLKMGETKQTQAPPPNAPTTPKMEGANKKHDENVSMLEVTPVASAPIIMNNTTNVFGGDTTVQYTLQPKSNKPQLMQAQYG